MGSTGDFPEQVDERPQHTVHLDAFWIDRTEVTNARYRLCVEAGACAEPECWDDDALNAPDQPVVCVTWRDAVGYAAWAGGRLPTEAEWEKAARGTDGRLYPWGDGAPDCERANYNRCVGLPLPVGSLPGGASPYGVLDMAGNVHEWVSDRYGKYSYADSARENPLGPDSGFNRVTRGGSFRWQKGVRCASRSFYYPELSSDDRGFRVVVPDVAGP